MKPRDPDGIAKTEAGHFMKCSGWGNVGRGGLFLGLHFEPERIQMPQVVINPGNSFFAK